MTEMAGNPQDLCEGSLFIFALSEVTEAAARAAYKWIGRGDRGHGDSAAIEAMRRELDALPMFGKVVLGEGKGDGSRGLDTGERIGSEHCPSKFDIAVDPVEGITYLAKGMTNAMSVIGLAPTGTM